MRLCLLELSQAWQQHFTQTADSRYLSDRAQNKWDYNSQAWSQFKRERPLQDPQLIKRTSFVLAAENMMAKPLSAEE